MEYIEIFKEVHQQVTGVPFTMLNGREGKSLKEAYLAVAMFWKEKRGEALEEPGALLAFKHLLESIEDAYILDNFLPSIIYQNLQGLLNQAYGKRYTKEEKKAIRASNFIRSYTAEELEELAQIKRAYQKQKANPNDYNASKEPTSLGAIMKKNLNL